MSETARTTIPAPQEFHFDGRRFLQYGISPVKLASMKKKPQGTQENPVIKDGVEYVYNSKGKLVVLERVDPKTISANSIPHNSAPTKEQIRKMDEYAEKDVEPDADCPELSDEQMAEIMRKAMDKK